MAIRIGDFGPFEAFQAKDSDNAVLSLLRQKDGENDLVTVSTDRDGVEATVENTTVVALRTEERLALATFLLTGIPRDVIRQYAGTTNEHREAATETLPTGQYL